MEADSNSRLGVLEARCEELERELTNSLSRIRSLTAELAGRTHAIENLQARLEQTQPSPPPKTSPVLSILEVETPTQRPLHLPRHRSAIVAASRRLNEALRELRQKRSLLRELEEDNKIHREAEQRADQLARQIRAGSRIKGVSSAELDILLKDLETRSARVKYLEADAQKKADAIAQLREKATTNDDLRQELSLAQRNLAEEVRVLQATLDQRQRQIEAGQADRQRLQNELEQIQAQRGGDPELERLRKELKTLETSRVDLQAQARQLEVERDQSRERARAMAEQVEQLETERKLAQSRLEVALSGQRGLELERQNLLSERDEHLSRLAELTARIQAEQTEHQLTRSRQAADASGSHDLHQLALERAVEEARKREGEASVQAQQARSLALKAHEQARRLQQALSDVQDQLRVTDSERSQLQARLTESEGLRHEVEHLRTRLNQLEGNRLGLQSRLEQEEGRRSGMLSEVNALRERLRQTEVQANTQRITLGQQLEDARRDLLDTTTTLEQLRREQSILLSRTEQDRAVGEMELARLRSELAVKTDALAARDVEMARQRQRLEADLDQAEGRLKQVGDEKAALDATLQSLRQQLDSAEKDRDLARSQLMGVEARRSQLEGDQARLRVELEKSWAERDELSRSLAEHIASTTEHEEELNQLRGVVAERSATAEQSDARNRRRIQELEELQAQAERRQEAHLLALSRLEELDHNFARMREERDHLLAQSATHGEEISALEERVASAEGHLLEAHGRNAQLEKQLESETSMGPDLHIMELELAVEEAREREKTLQLEVDRLRLGQNEAAARVAVAEEQVLRLKAEAEEQRGKATPVLGDEVEMMARLEVLALAEVELERQKEALRVELVETRRELADLQHHLGESRSECEDLGARLERSQIEAETLRSQVEEQTRELVDLREGAHTHPDELDELRAELENAEKRSEGNTREMTDLRLRLDMAEHALHEMLAAEARRAELGQAHPELSEATSAQVEGLRRQLADLQVKQSDDMKAHQAVLDKLEESQDQLTRVISERDRLAGEAAELRQRPAVDIEKIQAAFDSKDREMARLKAELASRDLRGSGEDPRLEVLLAHVKKLETTEAELRAERDNLRDDFNLKRRDMTQQLDWVRVALAKAREAQERLHGELDELRTERDHLTFKLEAIKDRDAARAVEQQKLEEERKEIDYLRSERARMDLELRNQRGNLRSATEELLNLRPLPEQMRILAEQLEETRRNLTAAERERDTFASLRTRLTQVEYERDVLQREVSRNADMSAMIADQDALRSALEQDILAFQQPRPAWYRPKRKVPEVVASAVPEVDEEIATPAPPPMADTFEKLVTEGRRYRLPSPSDVDPDAAPTDLALSVPSAGVPAAWGRRIFSIDEAPEEGSQAGPSAIDTADLLEARQLLEKGDTQNALVRARQVWRKRVDDPQALALVLASTGQAKDKRVDVLVELDERLPPAQATAAQATNVSGCLFEAQHYRDAAAYAIRGLGQVRKPLQDPLLERAVSSVQQLHKAGDLRSLRAAAVQEGIEALPPRAIAPFFFMLEGFALSSAEATLKGARAGDLLLAASGKATRLGGSSIPSGGQLLIRAVTSLKNSGDRSLFDEIAGLFPAKLLSRTRVSVVVAPSPMDAAMAAEVERIRRRDSHQIVVLTQSELAEAIVRNTGRLLLVQKIP